MGYHWPPPGKYEPFELHHYIGNYLSSTILALKEKGSLKLNAVRDVICGLLDRYSNGTYQYNHSKRFNPQIANSLKSRVRATVRRGATSKELSDLAESLERAIDRPYLEIGRPDKTKKAIQEFKNKLRSKRGR